MAGLLGQWSTQAPAHPSADWQPGPCRPHSLCTWLPHLPGRETPTFWKVGEGLGLSWQESIWRTPVGHLSRLPVGVRALISQLGRLWGDTVYAGQARDGGHVYGISGFRERSWGVMGGLCGLSQVGGL